MLMNNSTIKVLLIDNTRTFNSTTIESLCNIDVRMILHDDDNDNDARVNDSQ